MEKERLPFKFDIQHFADLDGDGEGDQLKSVMFDIDGKQVPFNELDPNTVLEWQKSHGNMDQFTASNTKKAQALADERRDFDSTKQSFENEREKLNYLMQFETFFNQHPEAAQELEQLINRHRGQPAQFPNQMGIPPELMQRLEKIEQSLGKVDDRFGEGERERERVTAYTTLGTAFGDKFDQKSFDDYLMNKAGNFDTLSDLYTLVEKARLYDAMTAQQAKVGSGLESGETSSGKIEPVERIEVGEGQDSVDAVFEDYAKKRGIEDY